MMTDLKVQFNQSTSLSDPMLSYPYQIQRVRRESRDTFTLTLQPASGPNRFLFLPGQFNMLYLFGVGEVPISISGNPADTQNVVHTVRAVGAVTKAIQKLKKGDVLGLRGPFGSAWPVAECRGNDMVIVAGGLGLAPIRPAICDILAHRPEYGNFELIYGARSAKDLLYKKELEQWRSRFDFHVNVTVDSAEPDWQGDVGLVTAIIPRACFDLFHTVAFVCGPGVMIRFVVMELLQRGLKMENIFVSLERNMKCGIGLCGHCQFGPFFICKDGPVFSFDRIQKWFNLREI